MQGLILRWFLSGLSLILTATILTGIEVHSFGAALIAALVLGVVNAIVRPLFIFFTLPLNILTLGLFTLVINAFMLMLTSSVVSGFDITGFGAAFIGSLLLSVISTLLNGLVRD